MKPILFNTDMVKAILEGSKTQTRRVVKLLTKDPDEWEADNFVRERAAKEYSEEYAAGCWPCFVKRQDEFYTAPKNEVRCIYYPKYVDGDVFYVRETWGIGEYDSYAYKADGISAEFICNDGKWRPSIHMPKEAARLFLRIKKTRAERLQDISDNDIKAEGLLSVCSNCYHYNGNCKDFAKAMECKLRSAWISLWDSTVKPADLNLYGWNENPWVWVYEFELVNKAEIEYLRKGDIKK